ncbi:MAG: polar amino acid transport system substrate-binding protein [Alteromonadaceae bacterium]|jgi:polar amino acid transport system substrate-binding protein
MKLGWYFGIFINGYFCTCSAQNITVGMEPFPPFITAQATGYSVDMLRSIEKISDLKFDIIMMTYARAKHELEFNRIDIAGPTPKKLETTAFYQYAQELDWQVSTKSDLFSLDKKYFNSDNLQQGRIGTTLGNADFFADKTGIARSKFIETSTLNQLVSLLLKGRIDVLIFERVSVMSLLQAQSAQQKVYYQSIGEVAVSIAVAKNEAGNKLKTKLDRLIKQIDQDSIFSSYLKYSHLPDSGTVPIIKSPIKDEALE